MPLIELSGCDSCTLKKEWQWLSTPKMPLCYPTEQSDVRILAVGEGPGEQEDIDGRPFVGKTGRFLREYIPKEWEKKLYWQNSVRCRPPKNRTPSWEEVKCCSTYLEQDIKEVDPQIILCIGTVSVEYFLPEHYVGDVRGIFWPVFIAGKFRWLYSIFHPSYVVRADKKDDKGKITNGVKPVFQADLRKFFSNVEKYAHNLPIIEKLPEIIYPQSFQEAWNLFERLKDPYGIDIETFKKKPYKRDALLLTSAFSDGELTFAVPCQWPGLINTWGFDFFKNAMSSRRCWVAHNAGMELPWVVYHTNEIEQSFDDTMMLARVYHHRRGILSLNDQTYIHLGVPVKKLTNVNAMNSPDYFMHRQREFLEYNAYDSWGSAKLIRKVKIDDEQKGNYQRLLDVTKSGVCMELAGLDVDLTETEKLSSILEKQLDEINARALALPDIQRYQNSTGRKFRISSGQVVGQVLHDYCNIPLPKTPNGDYSTAEGDLQEYSDHPVVASRLEYQETNKLHSTYVKSLLDGTILGIDSRLHPAYKALGTVTGRLSSEDPNFQNWPKRKHKEIRKQIVAPPGFIFATFDYGQLEARLIAMASNDKPFKTSIIQKEDVHSKWLKRVIAKYPDYIIRLREKTGQKEEKKLLKTGRDIIKTDLVFATFYGSIPPSVSKRTMIPLKIADELINDEFWPTYQGVKDWVDGQFSYYYENGIVKTLTNYIRDEVVLGNEPINSAIQGSAAHIVIDAQIALTDIGIHQDEFFLPRWNIHDDLGFILPDNNDTDRYIQAIGEEIVKPRHPFISVPLMTEVKVGYDWADMEEIANFTGAYFESN